MKPNIALWILRCVRLWSCLAYPVQTVRFRHRLGYWPAPAWPTRLNDKFHWRKIFDRNPLFTECSDKLAAKDFVRRTNPKINIPETLWVGERAGWPWMAAWLQSRTRGREVIQSQANHEFWIK